MPLYLRAPRKETHSWEIRGTYLGVRVERSTGAAKRSVALAQLRKLERAIEAGEYPPKPADRPGEPTFLSAAVAYMQHGGSRRYVGRLIKHFGETPLREIDQAAIDAAALDIGPNVTAGTRNAYVYTPVSAILHHALGNKAPTVRRPKGAKGNVRTDFLSESDARAIIQAADADLAILLQFLLYTGCRLGEALALTWDDVDLEQGYAYIKHTKNGDPRTVLLRQDLRDALKDSRGGVEGHAAASERMRVQAGRPWQQGDGSASCPPDKAGKWTPNGRADAGCAGSIPAAASQPVSSPARERLFPFRQGGHLKWKLRRATLKACGISAPIRRPDDYETPPHRLRWVCFHTMRHTFASWFRRAGGDVQGLVATGNWRDTRSAARYAHVVARDEWERVAKMPKVGT